MATRDDFTSKEWEVLAKTPDAVCLAMIAAQEGGAVAERNAFFEAWKVSSDQPFSDNQLVLTLIRGRDALGGDIAFEAQRDEGYSSMDAGPTRETALAYCRSAGDLLRGKGATDDFDAYRQWLLFIAEHIAQSSKTGGFLGIGGQAIAPAEQDLMNDVVAALKG
jgi:hypothetical protein